MREGDLVDSLISEYSSLVGNEIPGNQQQQYSRAGIVRELVKSAEWTRAGADELMRLVDDHGAFMLRNALALSVVLNKEDGSLNF